MALTDLIPDPNQPNPVVGTLSPLLQQQKMGDPPSLGPLPALGGAAPSPMSMGGLKPIVTSPRQQQEQELQQKISSLENPAKPQGFWQKLGHTLAQTGVVQNSGTMVARRGAEDQRVKELAGLQGQDVTEQDAASKRTLESAQAAQLGTENELAPAKAASEESLQAAQAYALRNPKPKSDFELWSQEHPTGTAEDYQAYQSKPLTQEDADARNAIWDRIAQQNHLPLGQFRAGMPTADAAALAAQLNNVISRGQGAQKISIDLGNQALAGGKQDVAARKAVYTAYQPVMDSAERFNVMSKNYEDAIKDHDQQAMLSLLYNHMGMTMGLQKGARMTQALIKEAQDSQPWLKGMEAKFDKDGYLSGVTLSPMQMQEMVHNAQGRYSEDVQKARNEAGYLGATDDGPDRTPNSSTINYYLSKANGDVTQAKKLAEADGWKVSGVK
jgi:hypothetical protein